MRQAYCVLGSLLLATSCADLAQPTREQARTYIDALIVQPELGKYAELEVANTSAIALVDGTNPYVGLRVYPHQPKVNSGKRAEISIDYPYSPGDSVCYSWKVMLPEVFPSDAPANRWWVMAQWHDQPNPNNGETWNGFPSHSPALLLGYGMKNDADYLQFQYGVSSLTPIGLVPLSRGQWLRIRMEIHWSQGADGSASLYLDDSAAPAFAAHGPNMFNAFQHYFKLGQYRHPDINTENWVYIDEISIMKQ